MSTIEVTPDGEGRFRVRVRDGGSETNHEVTAPPSSLEELGIAGADPEHVVRESFSFLLEREPAASIMTKFDLTTIPGYFGDYPEEIRRRLG